MGGLILFRRAGLGLLVLVAEGCGPHVEFVQTSCAKVPNTAAPKALEFSSTLKVDNLQGEQVIYSVELLNAAARPVRSRDGKFQDAEGHVGATRAFIVAEPAWVLENATVSIPWDQLELQSEDPPAMAEFSLRLADGTPLASERVGLPFGAPRRTGIGRRPADDKASAMADRLKRPEAQPGRRPPKPAGERAPAQDRPRAGAGERATSRSALPPRAAEAESRANAAARSQDQRRPPGFTPPPKTTPPPADRTTTQPAKTAHPTSRSATPLPNTPARAEAGAASSQPAQIDPLGARRYVVKKGDTLPGIAQRILGKAARWPEILELNRDQLDSSDNLKEGMELWLPLPDPKLGRRD